MFKRREPIRFYERLISIARSFVWPRGGWTRLWHQAVWHMSRIRATPHELALGFSAGAFISWTPLWGFHILLAALIAWTMRGNIIASALGTIVGNPITFPLIFAADYWLGMFLLHGKLISWNNITLPSNFEDAFYPLLVGSIPLGAICAVVIYFPVFFIVRAYQRAKEEKNKND